LYQRLSIATVELKSYASPEFLEQRVGLSTVAPLGGGVGNLIHINELQPVQSIFSKGSDMRLYNSAKDYGAIPQVLHWLTVFLVALAWALGTFDDVLPKGWPRDSGLFVHISAGIAILALLVARVAWRLVDPVPPPEATEFGNWMGVARSCRPDRALAVPVVGIVLQFARGDGLPLFGLAEIPSPWLKDRAFAHSVKEVHEVLAHALVILATMHAAAALIHHWIFRDRTLVRMLPHSNNRL
jgi:cytochrome b561